MTPFQISDLRICRIDAPIPRNYASFLSLATRNLIPSTHPLVGFIAPTIDSSKRSLTVLLELSHVGLGRIRRGDICSA